MSMLFLIMMIAYLLGSIPFGKIMGKRRGIDIQQHGSGNIGFANCLRILGWKPAMFVLAGDMLKGFIPVFFALQFFPPELVMFVGLAAIVGHIFPVWLNYRGGKGIATGLGVLLAMNFPLALTCIAIWLVLFAMTKLNALASVFMIISLPILSFVVAGPLLPLSTALLVLGTWTHRKNIENLFHGKEKQLL